MREHRESEGKSTGLCGYLAFVERVWATRSEIDCASSRFMI